MFCGRWCRIFLTYLFLTPVLAAGTVTDLRFRKVPNGVIGFGAAAGLAILTAERLSGDGGAAGVVFRWSCRVGNLAVVVHVRLVMY